MRNRGKIVIVCSNKGGVGKTFITRAIADYFDQVGQAWAGFDADHSSGKFRQFYRERVSTVDLRREETLGQVIMAAQGESGTALLDVPAAHGAELTSWLSGSGLVRQRLSLPSYSAW